MQHNLFPNISNDSDMWNGFARNVNIVQLAENLQQNEKEIWQSRKDKIVTSYENELLQNFFKELIKFQCRNTAMDVDFENFFKVNTRSVEHLITDFSFSVRVPNGVVSNRLLRDFFGLDYPLVLRAKNDLRAAMAQSTQSKVHEVTPIKAEFFFVTKRSSSMQS